MTFSDERAECSQNQASSVPGSLDAARASFKSLAAGVLAALALAAMSGACKNSPQATGSTCPSNSTLTYESFGKAFMDAHCTTCHSSARGNGDHPLLDTVTQIRNNSAAIDRTSAAGPNATNDAMPQDEDVAEDERKKLGEWLACGAP